MKFLRYILGLGGAFVFCIAFLLLMSVVMDASIGLVLGLFAPAAFAFIFIGSLFGEMLYRLTYSHTRWVGASLYFVLGVIYGGVITALVTVTLKNPQETVTWIWIMVMMGIASLVFYTIRQVDMVLKK